MGVANYLSMGHYDTYQNMHYTAYDRDLQSMINSIPKGSSVAIQNNMPQLVQFYNYTLPVNGYNGTPQYIIADPYSSWFYNLGITSNAVTDTLSLVNHKLNSGDYGILMEESGMALLENNYKGNITNFVPYKTTAFNNAYINFLAPGEYMVNINNNITISSEQKTFTVNSDNGIVSFTLNEYLTGVKVATESTETFTITQI